jgi:hypothetical protein
MLHTIYKFINRSKHRHKDHAAAHLYGVWLAQRHSSDALDHLQELQAKYDGYYDAPYESAVHGYIWQAMGMAIDRQNKSFERRMLSLSGHMCAHERYARNTHAQGECWHGVGHGFLHVWAALQKRDACHHFDEKVKFLPEQLDGALHSCLRSREPVSCASGIFHLYYVKSPPHEFIQTWPAFCVRIPSMQVRCNCYRMLSSMSNMPMTNISKC